MSTSLLLLLAGAAVLYVVATPTAAAAGGEWQPIKNITDSRVQGLGKCAVEEQNKVTNCGLRFVKLLRGEVQTRGSTTYMLLDVDALRLNGSHKIYRVELLEQNSSGNETTCELASFGPGC